MNRYFAVHYGDIIVLLYHEDMEHIRDLLYKNSQEVKVLKRYLEYCHMLGVKVALEGLKGEKTRGLKTALTYVMDHDMGMTEEQILGANELFK